MSIVKDPIEEKIEQQDHDQITPWLLIKSYSDKLDAFGVEIRGIDRIQSSQRDENTTRQFIAVIGFWISAAGGLTSVSTFILGSTVFHLTFKESVGYGILGQLIGCLFAAYCATMGPQSGCRQMVTARYLFGWWFVKFVSLIGCVGAVGWSVVNCVVGGQILASVSDGKVPLVVGIIVVALLSFVISIFGIKIVLKFENYIAVPVITVFILLYICTSKDFAELSTFENDADPVTKNGNILSFIALSYACTGTWGPCTSDYYNLFPESTPSYQVFLLTFFGIAIPTGFVGILGCILSTLSMVQPNYIKAYGDYGLGGALEQGLHRWNGFGKFCNVILLLSLVANNIINTYSSGFLLQLFGIWLAKVPRWIWAILVTVVYLICALVGRKSFSNILGNFLPMIGYWVSMYFIMLLEENVIFRRNFHHLYTKEFPVTGDDEDDLKKSNSHRLYNWDVWNDYDALTHGYAAMFAFACGVIGVVIGMAQYYYVGIVAKKIGENGGDIGTWLSMGITGLVFPFVRYSELKKFGK